MIEVRVPATSANVGPGFDCMGIAVSAYAYVRFEQIAEGLEIQGCDPQWQNEQNLVYQGYLKVMKAVQQPITPLRITIDAAQIPEARGLGSSAVCIVAGAMGANALCGNVLSRQELLDLCTEMEGHPDNVAPAIFGGLTISFMEANRAYTVRYDVDSSLRFCAMIPDYPILTKKAREVLPKTLTYADAIYNIGRCAALAKALGEGDYAMIAHACDDRLHQPYRKALFPEYADIDALCKQHGVLTWYISGSGSTMMAITESDEKADQLLADVVHAYPTWQVKKLTVDETGAQTKEVAHG